MDQRLRAVTRRAAQSGTFEDALALRRERARTGALEPLRAEALELGRLLGELERTPRARLVFGASHHDYRRRPPLSEETLTAFERRHEVLLPDDHRFFLTHVTSGGAGPYYGLHTLEEATREADLSLPFPWIEQVELSDEDYELWLAGPAERMPGILQLCHHGCGYYDFLVVRGEAVGSMWHDGTAADMGLSPLGKTFAGWYRSWLEDKLRSLPRLPLLERVRVGMSLAEVETLLGPTLHRRPAAEGHLIADFAALPVTLGLHQGKVTRVGEVWFV